MTLLRIPLSATFIKISLFYFFYFASVSVYIIFLPKMLKELLYSSVEIGIVLSIAPLVRFITPFLFLHLLRLDKNFFIISLFASLGLSFVVIASLDNFYLLCVCFVFMGFFWSVLLPFVETIATRYAKNNYGFLRLFGSLGFVLLALIFARLDFSIFNLGAFYIASIALTAVFGLSLSNLVRIKKQTQNVGNGASMFGAWQFWLMIFFVQTSFGGLYNFFTIYEEQRGLSAELISYLWAVGVGAEIMMFLLQRNFFMRMGVLFIIKLCVAILIVRWLMLFGFGDIFLIVAISQSLHAFGFALLHSASMLYIRTSFVNKSLAQQFYAGIGNGLGSFAGSLIAGFFMGDWLFAVMALCAVLALGLVPKHKI